MSGADCVALQYAKLLQDEDARQTSAEESPRREETQCLRMTTLYSMMEIHLLIVIQRDCR